MIKEVEIVLKPENLFNKEVLYSEAARITKSNPDEIKGVVIKRRSIDARRKEPVYRLLTSIFINEKPEEVLQPVNYKTVKNEKKIIIVGCGPAGMFAALRLIELGIKPIIIERGKNVKDRRRDLRAIQQEHIVNPDSNYCFGEGGAGTYSDGKLYTRSTKRGNVKKILQVLVQHGAQEDILIDAHPHIGSNKLPIVVGSIRETILKSGGEVHFNSRVTDFLISNNLIKGVVVNNSEEIFGDVVILATGHSARDIFYLLNNKNILIEPKPFALGVRVEHPQSLIDEIQYHSKVRHPNLPASSYSLTCQIDEKGVFSFCMCPGGIIVPAATSPGEIVVNGMSVSRRNSPFANSGLVATVNEKDWKEFDDYSPLSALKYQSTIEENTFTAGGKTQTAPAQRLTDFVEGKISSTLPKSSYIPGVVSYAVHELLPVNIVESLRKALLLFNKQKKGYYSEEAQLLAVESRTSSPVKIPRDKETYMHPFVTGLFPSGEGAGYAGGIVSAAIDGENCADAAMKFLSK